MYTPQLSDTPIDKLLLLLCGLMHSMWYQSCYVARSVHTFTANFLFPFLFALATFLNSATVNTRAASESDASSVATPHTFIHHHFTFHKFQWHRLVHLYFCFVESTNHALVTIRALLQSQPFSTTLLLIVFIGYKPVYLLKCVCISLKLYTMVLVVMQTSSRVL